MKPDQSILILHKEGQTIPAFAPGELRSVLEIVAPGMERAKGLFEDVDEMTRSGEGWASEEEQWIQRKHTIIHVQVDWCLEFKVSSPFPIPEWLQNEIDYDGADSLVGASIQIPCISGNRIDWFLRNNILPGDIITLRVWEPWEISYHDDWDVGYHSEVIEIKRRRSMRRRAITALKASRAFVKARKKKAKGIRFLRRWALRPENRHCLEVRFGFQPHADNRGAQWSARLRFNVPKCYRKLSGGMNSIEMLGFTEFGQSEFEAMSKLAESCVGRYNLTFAELSKLKTSRR